MEGGKRMSDKPKPIYTCTVRVENKDRFAGYEEVTLHATEWKLDGDCLTFATPSSRKMFNWAKVFYYDVKLGASE